MPYRQGNISRKKVFSGVAFLCAAVLLMLIKSEDISLAGRLIWLPLFSLGIFFYLWGRFFSKGDE